MLVTTLATVLGAGAPAPAAEPLEPLEDLEWEELPDPEEDGVDEASADPQATAAESAAEVESEAKPEARAELTPPPPRPSAPPPEEPPPLDLERGTPEPASRPPRAPAPRRRSVYPRTWFSVGVLASKNLVGLSLGGLHFMVPWVGLGLEVEDAVWWNDQGTFNVFRLTPKAMILVLPRFNVTPFLRGGFGGEFFSHQLGSYGRWVGGAGVLFRIRQRWYVELGVDTMGRVPDSRFADNFRCAITSTPCSLTIEPQIGLGIGF